MDSRKREEKHCSRGELASSGWVRCMAALCPRVAGAAPLFLPSEDLAVPQGLGRRVAGDVLYLLVCFSFLLLSLVPGISLQQTAWYFTGLPLEVKYCPSELRETLSEGELTARPHS